MDAAVTITQQLDRISTLDACSDALRATRRATEALAAIAEVTTDPLIAQLAMNGLRAVQEEIAPESIDDLPALTLTEIQSVEDLAAREFEAALGEGRR